MYLGGDSNQWNGGPTGQGGAWDAAVNYVMSLTAYQNDRLGVVSVPGTVIQNAVINNGANGPIGFYARSNRPGYSISYTPSATGAILTTEYPQTKGDFIDQLMNQWLPIIAAAAVVSAGVTGWTPGGSPIDVASSIADPYANETAKLLGQQAIADTGGDILSTTLPTVSEATPVDAFANETAKFLQQQAIAQSGGDLLSTNLPTLLTNPATGIPSSIPQASSLFNSAPNVASAASLAPTALDIAKEVASVTGAVATIARTINPPSPIAPHPVPTYLRQPAQRPAYVTPDQMVLPSLPAMGTGTILMLAAAGIAVIALASRN